MKWMTVAPEEALGNILCHNVADAQGHKALHKGITITEQAVAQMQALGVTAVTVAALGPDDVHEDEAAQRLTRACMGDGVSVSVTSGGRVNLIAKHAGVVKLNRDALLAVNEMDGMTVATLRHDATVTASQMVATVKIIPFAVPEAELQDAVRRSRESGGIVSVRPMPSTQVGVILTGSESARERVMQSFAPPIRARVEALGSEVRDVIYVAQQSKAITSAIELLRVAGAGLIILAGETSIMDRDDVTPQSITQAGGRIEHYGAPVEPGNLLLLAYIDPSPGSGRAVPVIGAPGCVRSRDANVVDLVLPRLLAGERLTRADIVALAEGGLLL